MAGTIETVGTISKSNFKQPKLHVLSVDCGSSKKCKLFLL